KKFSCDGILEVVAKFVTCDDQSPAVANKASFRNCLIIMRPKTIKQDLPTTHSVSVYIHNQFIEQLKQLKIQITVS
ncbi:hypothetical protein L208DRAFT_1286927, partial [Tricholoma matsutake]